MSHDIGKFVEKWLDLFIKKVNMPEDERKNAPIKNHTSAGAAYIYHQIDNNHDFLRKLIAYLIVSSHGGLPNHTNKKKRTTFIQRKEEFSEYIKEIDTSNIDFQFIKTEIDNLIEELKKEKNLPITFSKGKEYFQLYFFVKMLFSCTVDADCVDTKEFMDNKKDNREIISIEKMMEKYLSYMGTLESLSLTPINKARKEMREIVQQEPIPPGSLCSTTMFTGAGKTLAVTGLGLKSMLSYSKYDKFIYVVKNVSIISEIAKTFQDIFGKENILVHYRDYDRSSKWVNDGQGGFSFYEDPTIFSVQNWGNIKIILTTDVQFFETLFSNKNGKCRKMHNICNSFIFFDEPQTLSPGLVIPCTSALKELSSNYGCSVVFATATQPFRYQNYLIEEHKFGIRELLPNYQKVVTPRRGVRIETTRTVRAGKMEVTPRRGVWIETRYNRLFLM